MDNLHILKFTETSDGLEDRYPEAVIHIVKPIESEKDILRFVKEISNSEIRVGHRVIILGGEAYAREENYATYVLFKNLQDAITILLHRGDLDFKLPWPPSLREEEELGFWDYSDTCGGCSGNCSNC